MEIDRQKKERIILTIVAVCLFAASVRVLFRPKKAQPQPAALAGQNAAPAAADLPLPAPGPGVLAAQPAYPAELVFSKDPFDLPEGLHKGRSIEVDQDGVFVEKEPSAETMPAFEISGIIFGGKSPRIFVNDKAYKPGDTIGDAQLLEIDRKAALFLYGRRKIWINLKERQR